MPENPSPTTSEYLGMAFIFVFIFRHNLFSYSNIICDFLEFGWPIGYTSELYPVSHMRNHPSAVAYPQHVQHYIETEIQYRALLGPFSCLPFETFHVSPLMTRPKKNSSKRRVIMDFLHFPVINLSMMEYQRKHISDKNITSHIRLLMISRDLSYRRAEDVTCIK